jgi:hypothetical protein
MMTEIETVPPSTFPEVRAFLKAKKALDELRATSPRFFEDLRAIAELWNPTLDAADKVVRAAGVSCGPFELYSHVTKYSANALLIAVGEGRFQVFGGATENVPEHTIDKEAFKALVAQGKVANEIIAAVVTHEPRYHKPEKIVLP